MKSPDKIPTTHSAIADLQRMCIQEIGACVAMNQLKETYTAECEVSIVTIM